VIQGLLAAHSLLLCIRAILNFACTIETRPTNHLRFRASHLLPAADPDNEHLRRSGTKAADSAPSVAPELLSDIELLNDI
jgi:hypothetical protein